MTEAQKIRVKRFHADAHSSVESLVDAFRFGTLEDQIKYAAEAAKARRAALRIEAEA